MSKTYGDFPGVKVQTTYGSLSTTTDDAIGTLLPGVRLWDHRINLSGDDSISCEECEMEKEIPDLLQMTSGYRQALWKMYILGQFKHTPCEPEYEIDQSVLHTNTTNIGYDSGKVTTTSGRELDKLTQAVVPQNQLITVAGEHWEHDGNGVWHSHDSPAVKRSCEMKLDFGKEFTSMLQMIVTQTQDTRWHKAGDNISLGSVSMGSNRGGVDHSAGRSTDTKSTGSSLDTDSNLDKDEKESLKEKFVSALSSGETTLR